MQQHRILEQHRLEGISEEHQVQHSVEKRAQVRQSTLLFSHILKTASDEDSAVSP